MQLGFTLKITDRPFQTRNPDVRFAQLVLNFAQLVFEPPKLGVGSVQLFLHVGDRILELHV